MKSTEDSHSGVLYIDKPEGITSHDVVNRVRRLYGTRRVGHTGTLDPMASGVMVVLVGRAAKAAEYITAEDKGYWAELLLGITTDTGDITGQVTARAQSVPDETAVTAAAVALRGDSLQTPPMYSALKVNGQKLVDLARRGIEVARAPRPISISRLDVTPIDPADGRYRLTVECSKGTYIRTICEDIGTALGCGGTMASLRRFRSGRVTLKDCISLAQLERLSEAERLVLLAPISSLFADWEQVQLPCFFARLAHAGCEIYQKKIGTSYEIGQRLTLYDSDGFFAIGEVAHFEAGSAIRPIKQFRLEVPHDGISNEKEGKVQP